MEEPTKKYYAHSENILNQKHSLSDHLNQTSKYIEFFACQENYKAIFKITGLLHDLGKYQLEFQRYLERGGKRGSVPHSSWGAGYARILGLNEVSIAIDGHHKGMPNISDWKSDTEPFKRNEILNFNDVVEDFLRDTGIDEAFFKKQNALIFTDSSQREVFIRYLFSALADSDWLSTEEHFELEKSQKRMSKHLDLDVMIKKLEEEVSKKPKTGEINQLRNSVRNQALEKANIACGFYSLALPTGMGKTLTSMAWALHHAKKNNLKRIIIVLPYINIIDQTAQVLKNIFGDEWVLEHHSNFNENDPISSDNSGNYFVTQERKRLACENWDYPIILTTTVQFFESLFGHRTSRCRKIHNIAESVVIFDEVQTLPKEIILPTLQMLKSVQSVMKVSFLFCTATQPAFEKRLGFDGITTIFPLIEDTAILYEKTKRVEYHLLNNLEPLDYGSLCNALIQTADSALVIFNTKKAALEFYHETKDLGNWERKHHLSTAMCPAHRKDVIKSIREDLEAKRKILVVSTQLIEAGVDFDFPVVFRAMAPLEAVIQSAGRCNREGKLGKTGGRVFLFKLQNGGMPDKTYAACAGYAEELIKQNVNQLYEHDIFNRYYANVIQLYVDPDKYKINEARNRFDYETVNDAYHIIDNITEGLFIYNYSDESRMLLHSLEFKEFLSRNDFRKIQAFTVNVYKDFIIKNSQMCKIMSQGFTVWYGNYDSHTGISLSPVEADRLVV
jgi:CRISPR-associated endonuclease/helicase Cas3